MVTDKRTKLFFRWLKNQGLYAEYIDEFLACYYHRKHYAYYSPYTDINCYVNEIIVKNIERVIDTSLIWADTKRGRMFWSGKNNEWKKYLFSYKWKK